MGRSGNAGADRGEVSLQVVLLAPALLLLLLVVVQAALWFHAVQVAESAASDGASAAAHLAAGAGVGQAALADLVADAGARLNSGGVSRTETDMVATATVHVPHVLPWWPESVTRTARAPIERLTAVGG